MKVNIKRHCSFSIEPIIYTTTSLTNLLYSRIFFHKKMNKHFHNLVHGFTSKDFWIASNYSIQNQGCANLEFFFMVLKNKDPCRSKIMVENKLGTHNSSSLNFKAIRTTKLNNKTLLAVLVVAILWVHNTKFIHQVISWKLTL